jgi:hypothetical protein
VGKQIVRCYSSNRRVTNKVKLRCTGLHPDNKPVWDFLNGCSSGHWEEAQPDHVRETDSFHTAIREWGFEEEIKRESQRRGKSLVPIYLTADADEELQTLSPEYVYIIGGIVDRNRLKGVTLERAQQQGIRTAKLPISSYISLTRRHVLTTNHVFAILLEFLQQPDWERAFLTVLPKRHQAVPLRQQLPQEFIQEQHVPSSDQCNLITEESNEESDDKLKELSNKY